MLQNHNAGDVVGEGDLATQLVGDGAVGEEGLAGEQAGAEQRQAQQ